MTNGQYLYDSYKKAIEENRFITDCHYFQSQEKMVKLVSNYEYKDDTLDKYINKVR